tara:strand:- start:1629 stop:2231 length:603 start_codon:yes stop_codon:yes gene_type:complete
MRHKLTQGNIAGSQLQSLLDTLPNAHFCYTDPPWGTGNLKYWKTINKRMTGEEANQIDQQELEHIVVDCITKNVESYAFVVYGIKQADSIMKKFRAKPNVSDIQYIEKKYAAGSKSLSNCVIAITLNEAPIINWVSKLTNQNGIKGLDVVCEEFKGKHSICLDMFIGVGAYLKCLDKNGFTVYGNELNRARLEKAIGKVS